MSKSLEQIRRERNLARRQKQALMEKHPTLNGHPVTLEWMYAVECALSWVLDEEDTKRPSRLGETGVGELNVVVRRV